MNELANRYQGALLGLACGDAVGTTVEFSERGSFAAVTDMVGGGPFELQPGQWTDDTSMALCLAASLVHCQGFDAVDQMNRYVNWWQWGYYSCTSRCFDIGLTTAAALQRYIVSGDPMAGSDDPGTAGNGSLMRLAPVVLHFHPDLGQVIEHARLSSATTHRAAEALDACSLLAEALSKALGGSSKEEVLQLTAPHAASPALNALAGGHYRSKATGQVRSTGYCVDSLEAALWSFARTSSFEEAILTATNLGDDADTVAAITGQLAGAFYGASNIPGHWLQRLAMRDEIDRLALALFDAATARTR